MLRFVGMMPSSSDSVADCGTWPARPGPGRHAREVDCDHVAAALRSRECDGGAATGANGTFDHDDGAVHRIEPAEYARERRFLRRIQREVVGNDDQPTGVVDRLFWLVVAPLSGAGLFMGATASGIALPLLGNVLIWGGALGFLCDRWLSPPSTTAL